MNDAKHNITIFTDASWCPETSAGGGAFWARDNLHRCQKAFPITGAAQSHEAELIASCRAIVECLKDEHLGPRLREGSNTRLILVIDCLSVKQALEWRAGNGKRPRMSAELWEKVKRVRAKIDEVGFILKINHVKGHSGIGKPRNWVNNWCDKQAKACMFQVREKRRRSA